MATPTIVRLLSRHTSDGSRLLLTFVLSDGTEVQAEVSADAFAELSQQFLTIAGRLPTPQQRALTESVQLVGEPAPVRALAVRALSSTDAVLTIVVGPVPLQFATPLGDLFDLLHDLESNSEPDPNAAQRH